MIIKSVRIQNFRSIRDIEIECSPLTVLVGPNGSGKSAFLRAIDIFYQSAAQFTEDDYYNRDTSNDIVIAVTYTSLTEKELELFTSHVDKGELTVRKVIHWEGGKVSQRYFGETLGSPDFEQIRSETQKTAARKLYDSVREQAKYQDLPRCGNYDEVIQAIEHWEEDHPEECTWLSDSGQFFGFRQVGQAKLERFTRFVFVPAVRDAALDATEGRGSVMTEIMDLAVRTALSQKRELEELKEDAKQKYEGIIADAKSGELNVLNDDLTRILAMYVPQSAIVLDWQPTEAFEIRMPTADVRIVEDRFASSVERSGHGVQRAFILSVFQYLASAASTVEENETDAEAPGSETVAEDTEPPDSPNLIIAIEEPELFQHPSRQRHLAKVLLQLADVGIPGVARKTQVIYATHSPLFVDVERFGQVRKFEKCVQSDGSPPATNAYNTSIGQVTSIVEEAFETSFRDEYVRARFRAFLTPWMNEGFFAGAVVLVEGEKDRAALLGYADTMNVDLDASGISVVPCYSKQNLRWPYAMFRELGIATYIIWDSDYGKKDNPDENHALLRLVREAPEDWPEKVRPQFACYKTDMSAAIKGELGAQLYKDLMAEVRKEFDSVDETKILTNPSAMRRLFELAIEKGERVQSLEGIVHAITSLSP